ncbi:MAG TPA: hypothetical protein VEI02_13885, partial [Planctomycetota bacterium]|nr:hypothetical protein [Planctomycetota bacterium]
GRPATRSELLESLRSRRRRGDGAPFPGAPGDPWAGDDDVALALALQAYQAADARVEEQAELTDALLERRRIRGCGHLRAAADATVALARRLRGAGVVDVAGDVVASVDGASLPPLRIEPGRPRAALRLDPASLPPGARRIALRRVGTGAVDVRLVFEGARAAVDAVPAAPGFFTVDRRVTTWRDPDAPASEFAEGYESVDPARRPPWTPPAPLAQALVGARVTVRLVVTAQESASFVTVEDPLPAGFEPVLRDVRGPHDGFERRANRMTFHFRRLAKGRPTTVTYTAYAAVPGRVRALPAVAEEAFAPERRGASGSYAFETATAPERLERVEPAPPTPDARLASARAAAAAGDDARVVGALEGLAEAFPLTPEAREAAYGMLLRASLRLGRHEAAVRLHDRRGAEDGRGPAAGLTTGETLRLGRAYAFVGDGERALALYRVVLAAAFDEETRAGAFVRGLGRPADAAELDDLAAWRVPARDDVASFELEAAGRRLELPDPAAKAATARPLQGRQWAAALRGYQRVLAWHPGTAAAERAGVERIRLYRALGLPERTAEEARTFARRAPEAGSLDEATAALALAAFELGRFDEAAAAAEEVRTRLYPDAAKRGAMTRQSAYAPEMTYLLGKIAHVRGDLEAAVKRYGEAGASVAEAAASYAFFSETRLAADVVVRLKPGDPARLPLRVKNVPRVSVQTYPVDLGVLFAVRKSLDALNRADLSGIAPLAAVELETGAPRYREATFEAPLPTGGGATTSRPASAPATPPGALPPGAYLAVVVAGDAATSSLVLVSDLALTVQRGPGELRCALVDGAGLPVRGARLAIGVDGGVRFGGVTDERGMATVPLSSSSPVTVVAEAGDRAAVAAL